MSSVSLASLDWAQRFRLKLLRAGICPLYSPAERRIRFLFDDGTMPQEWRDELRANIAAFVWLLQREYRNR